jgi:transposase
MERKVARSLQGKKVYSYRLISQTGARLLYLPVYSPEFNPIEMMWSVLKNFIRQFHDSPVKNIQSITVF